MQSAIVTSGCDPKCCGLFVSWHFGLYTGLDGGGGGGGGGGVIDGSAPF